MPGRRSFSSTPMAVTGGDSTRVLPFRSRGRLGRRTEPGSLTRRSSGQHREMVTSTAPSTSPASTEPSACGLPPMARHLRGPRPDERSRTWQPATFRRTRTPGSPGSASSPRPSVLSHARLRPQNAPRSAWQGHHLVSRRNQDRDGDPGRRLHDDRRREAAHPAQRQGPDQHRRQPSVLEPPQLATTLTLRSPAPHASARARRRAMLRRHMATLRRRHASGCCRGVASTWRSYRSSRPRSRICSTRSGGAIFAR